MLCLVIDVWVRPATDCLCVYEAWRHLKAHRSCNQHSTCNNPDRAAVCPGDISDVSGWAAECRLCRHIVAMMFNVIVIMSLAGSAVQGRQERGRIGSSSGLLQLCQLCLIAGAWQVSAPHPLVSSVGFQVSIFNTNFHPHSPDKDRSEPNNFGYYVKNHKKSPKFNALWPFSPAIYKYLFTVSQFFSIFLSFAALHI